MVYNHEHALEEIIIMMLSLSNPILSIPHDFITFSKLTFGAVIIIVCQQAFQLMGLKTKNDAFLCIYEVLSNDAKGKSFF